MFLPYIYDRGTYTYKCNHSEKHGDEYIISFYETFYMDNNDTLDITLCAICVNYAEIYESYTNSSIEIYYVDYLDNNNVF